MDQSELNKEVARFYSNEFNIPERALDIMEIYDIMFMCAEGKSNTTISNELGIEDVKFISDALDSVFQFYGWDTDLDVNTYELFVRCTNKYGFESTVTTLSPLTKRSDATIAYEINTKLKQYNTILDELERKN